MRSKPAPSPDLAQASRPLPFGPLDALLVLVTVSWGLNSVAIKYAIGRFEPMVFNSLRFVYATALIFVVMWLTEGRRGGRQAFTLPRKDLWVIVGIGLVGHFVYQYLWITGINLSTAGNTAFIMATSPVSIALLSSLVGHGHRSPRLGLLHLLRRLRPRRAVHHLELRHRAPRAGAYHNLTPITTGVFAFWLLAEKWTALRFAGVAVILVGVTIVRRAKAGLSRTRQAA